jgi:hypothetical protein
MYKITNQKILKACGATAITVAALTGCTSTESSTTAAPDQLETQAVTDVFVKFFAGQTPPDQKATLVENGATFAPALQALQGQNPAANTTTATVSNVKLNDPNHADVTYSLMLGANPVLPNQQGKAVREGDQWKVAAATFCEVSALQGGTPPGC